MSSEVQVPADYDAWLTADPLDDDFCEEHNRARPCYRCQQEAAEDREECRREERGWPLN